MYSVGRTFCLKHRTFQYLRKDCPHVSTAQYLGEGAISNNLAGRSSINLLSWVVYCSEDSECHE